MKTLLAMFVVTILTTGAFAQTAILEAESNWKSKLDELNKEYFDKLRQLQAKQIETLEELRKNATTQDRLDEALRLRELIENMKVAMGVSQLPDDNGKLTRDKARVELILRKSKWNCADNPNLSKWFGKSFVFHESGTVLPSNDISTKIPNNRWAIIDGRTIVAMLGDYMIVFRLNDKGNAMEVLENGNCINTKDVRHGYVVKSPSITSTARDGK